MLDLNALGRLDSALSPLGSPAIPAPLAPATPVARCPHLAERGAS